MTFSRHLKAPVSPEPPRLGDCVKSLRRRLGLTLAEVSEATGLAVSTISKVENAQMSLTYEKIVQMAVGLKVDIAEFFFSTDHPMFLGRRSIDLADSSAVVETPNYRYQYPCADLAGRKMVSIIAEVKCRSLEKFGPLFRHSGEEYIYIIEGVVMFHTDAYKPVQMEAGSSAYFDAQMGHAYINIGEGPAKLLSVCTAPESELAELVR